MRSLALAAVLCAAFTASTAAKAEADQLTITSAHPDAAGGVLVIGGTGFRPGVAVSLENKELRVLSVKGREVRTTLPSSLPGGTYRLTVRSWYDSAKFVVAIYDGGGEAPPAGVTPLTLFASNGNVVGQLVGVTKLFGSDPAMVMRQDHGFWVTLGIDSTGIQQRSFPIFYTGDNCTGNAFAVMEVNPAPLVRGVQRMTATDTTGFFAGDPLQSLAFPWMQIEDFEHPGTKICVSAPDNGWGAPMFVGPLQTIDLAQFPMPFTIR